MFTWAPECTGRCPRPPVSQAMACPILSSQLVVRAFAWCFCRATRFCQPFLPSVLKFYCENACSKLADPQVMITGDYLLTAIAIAKNVASQHMGSCIP